MPPPVRPTTSDAPAAQVEGGIEPATHADSPHLASRGAGRTVQRVLLGVLLLVGAAGQIRVWASDRGLWNDEIYISNNLKYLPFRKLTGSLLYLQVAPPGWLVGEKAILKVLGPDEQLLKLPQVAGAVVVLLLTAVAARYAIGRWASLVAVGLVATSPLVYYYAGELKQYAFEAATAMVILVAAGAYGAVATGKTPPSWRRVTTFAAVVAVASAGGYSALVVLPGAAAGIALVQATRRQWRGMVVTALAATPGVAVGIVQAWLRWRLGFMRGQDRFFPHGFAPEHAGPIGILRWLPEMWQGFVVTPLYWRYPAIALVLVVGGLASLVIRGRPLWAAMIGGVFVTAIGAAALRGFPLEDRVALYMVAPTAIAVAAAADGAARLLVRAFRIRRDAEARTRGRMPELVRLGAALLAAGMAVGMAAVVARPAAVNAYHEVTEPRYRDAGRDVLRDVAARIRPGDVVVAYYFSEPLMTWYGRQYKLPMVGLAVLKPTNICAPASVGQRLAGAERVWYVHGAKLSRHPDSYNDWAVGQLARLGTVVESSNTSFPAAGWTLIDLRAGPDPNPPPVGNDPTYACLELGRMPRR
jgi:hypothetical protein